MSIPKTIITLREQKNMSQAQLAQLMGLNKNVMGRIERGERALRDNEVLKLAKIFNVSTDLILDNNSQNTSEEENEYYKLTDKDKKDIAKQIENIINQTENDADINFYGEPITDEDRELLANALEIGLRLSKEKAKKKFTPKKYRNNKKED